MELCASPPAVLDAVSTRKRLASSPPPTPDAVASALRDQPPSSCALLPAEPIALDRKGLPLPSPLAAQLLALGLAVRRYDAGEDGSVIVATRRTEILERAPQPLCPCAEHHRASPSALHTLRVERDAKPSACAMCGFVVPAASQWRCAACRAVAFCADCGPTSPLHDLGAALRGEPHDATLGEWPREDESGRVPCWLCWTGDNPMPAYLELCVDTFRRRLAARFAVRVVRAADVASLLDGDVHEAYPLLSLVHRADYLRCELLHRHGGLYVDCDTIAWGDLAAPLAALEASAAVLCEPAALYEDGLNAGLARRGSAFTGRWRATVRARLDAKLNALREFRAANDDPAEDALGWHEILRDVVVPIRAALAATIDTASLRAFRWRPRGEQGFDPLAIDDGADAPPAGTQLVVLTNNAYSARVKRLGRDEFLASGGDLARWVVRALGDG